MTKKTQEVQKIKAKPAFNLLAKYQRNDGLVEDGSWIAYVDETGEETSLEFKIASSDGKAYMKAAVGFYEENAELFKLVQSGKAAHEDNINFINMQQQAELHSAAQHLLKGWRWTDEAGVVHDGELPWGDGVLAFTFENAVELLSLKRAHDTFLNYVLKIANNYQNYLATNLQNDIKN